MPMAMASSARSKVALWWGPGLDAPIMMYADT
jgi:hypothetical protein